MKECNICGSTKSLSEFYKNCKGKQGVLSCCKICSEKKKKARLKDTKYAKVVKAQRAAGHANNREKRNAASNAQYEANKEARLAKQKQYYHDNKEDRSNYAKARRPEAREVTRKYRETNKEHVFNVNKTWRLNNKDKLTKNANRRKALEKQAVPLWAASEWDEFLIEEIYHLSKIRYEATGIKFHVDHIVPLQSDIVCGLHCSANLQLLPAKVNISKGNRFWPDMWEPLDTSSVSLLQ